MKRGPLLALALTVAVLAAGFLAFGLTRWLARPAPVATTDNELAWMQSEFHLTPAQVATIEKLHDDYDPICMEHCAAIVRARKQLATASDPDAARAELARLETVCRDATQAHLQRVAAVMAPAEGARFLALTTPKVATQSHAAPLDLR